MLVGAHSAGVSMMDANALRCWRREEEGTRCRSFVEGVFVDLVYSTVPLVSASLRLAQRASPYIFSKTQFCQ